MLATAAGVVLLYIVFAEVIFALFRNELSFNLSHAQGQGASNTKEGIIRPPPSTFPVKIGYRSSPTDSGGTPAFAPGGVTTRAVKRATQTSTQHPIHVRTER